MDSMQEADREINSLRDSLLKMSYLWTYSCQKFRKHHIILLLSAAVIIYHYMLLIHIHIYINT